MRLRGRDSRWEAFWVWMPSPGRGDGKQNEDEAPASACCLLEGWSGWLRVASSVPHGDSVIAVSCYRRLRNIR